jgi:hypothetical protein
VAALAIEREITAAANIRTTNIIGSHPPARPFVFHIFSPEFVAKQATSRSHRTREIDCRDHHFQGISGSQVLRGNAWLRKFLTDGRHCPQSPQRLS